ncbi:MAG: CaiB/BaiF CoA transferase family protein [Acidimicrobiales bacterium]|jgi:crotonobetainyl-CoA:carnitine CoA-transferase CaiB-like acyl-CoA transferase
MDRSHSPAALGGVLVADFSRVLAGPLATMLLGDLGADVVKVERPGSGDDTRAWGPPYVDGESAYFLAINRNKRSVALDLGTSEGKRAARRLVERADVVVENFKPGRMERLGLSYEEVSPGNPAVVYCTVSGFGTKGAGASLLGYDFIVQAVGGLMHITGPEAGEPTKVGVAVADVLTGLFAANAILAALLARSTTGIGQRVEVDLMSCLLAGLVNQASSFVTTGQVPRAIGNRHPAISPYEMFAAADRPLVIAVGNDGQFAALAGALGMEWLASDERFVTNPARVVHHEELSELIGRRLRDRPAATWIERFEQSGVPSGLVNDLGEAFALAERLGLSPVVRVGDPSRGDAVAQVADPMRLHSSPVTYRRRPPRLGEHTAEVLRELGL